MKNWMLDTVFETDELEEKRIKRKANRKKKLVIDAIKGHILNDDIKKAIDLCEKYGITPKEFGKIAKEVGEM